MGRFYKTAKPNMIDFMYQVPEQAILGAIKGVDTQLEQQEKYLTDFQKQLKHQALIPDSQRQKEKLTEYENQIKEHALKISTSPLEALKQKQGIRELGNKIYEDVTRGELAAQYAQYALRQKHLEEETKRATGKDGEIKIEDVNRAMAEFDRRYAAEKRDPVTGELIEKGGLNYNPVTGTYRSYSPEKLVNYFDITNEQLKYAEKWLPDVDQTFETETIQGDYYVTTKSSDKILTANNLAKGLYNLTIANPEATRSFNQNVNMFGAESDEKKLAEFNRIYGSREQPFNPHSPLKMVQVKDAQGNLVFKDMKKKDGTIEKVPVMQVEQLGEIMSSALAVAEQRDINQVSRISSKDMTEEAQMKLRVEEDKLKAANKEALENTNGVTTHNNEVQVLNFGTATNWKQIEDNFTTKSNTINSTITNSVNSFGKIIEGLDPNVYKDKKAMLETIRNLANSKKWTELKGYIESKGLAGIKGIGTSVEELAMNVQQAETTLKNDRIVYDSLITRIKNSQGTQKGKTFNQELAEVDAEIAKAKEYRDRWAGYPNTPGYKDGQRMMNDAINKKNEINRAYSNKVNMEINNTNRNTKNVTISNADDAKGIARPETITAVQNVYSNIKNNILSIFNSGGNAVVVTNGKEGAATSLNQLLENNNIDLTEQIMQNGEVKNKYGDPKTFRVVGVGNAQDNLQIPVTYVDKKTGKQKTEIKDLGKNAIAITILRHDKELNRPVQSVVYMDKNDLSNTDLTILNQVMGPITTAKSFADDAKVKLAREVNAGGNRDELHQVSVEGVVIYPFSGQGGKWVFPDGTTLYGDAGKNYYAEMLGASK